MKATPCSAFTTISSGLCKQLINEATIEYNTESLHINKALWDTGATGTSISMDVVNKLHMIPIGKQKIHTPSGEKTVNQYMINVTLSNNVKIANLVVFDSEIGNQGIDMLIGMDIISYGDFSVSNYQGQTYFSFRVPSQSHINYVQMLENMKPISTSKKTYPNELCPCGSGKKYKHCCGRNQ